MKAKQTSRKGEQPVGKTQLSGAIIIGLMPSMTFNLHSLETSLDHVLPYVSQRWLVVGHSRAFRDEPMPPCPTSGNLIIYAFEKYEMSLGVQRADFCEALDLLPWYPGPWDRQMWYRSLQTSGELFISRYNGRQILQCEVKRARCEVGKDFWKPVVLRMTCCHATAKSTA